MSTIQSSCAQIPKDDLGALVQIRCTSSYHTSCPKQLQEFQLPEPIASKIWRAHHILGVMSLHCASPPELWQLFQLIRPLIHSQNPEIDKGSLLGHQQARHQFNIWHPPRASPQANHFFHLPYILFKKMHDLTLDLNTCLLYGTHTAWPWDLLRL